jgi:hypothetical protein
MAKEVDQEEREARYDQSSFGKTPERAIVAH